LGKRIERKRGKRFQSEKKLTAGSIEKNFWTQPDPLSKKRLETGGVVSRETAKLKRVYRAPGKPGQACPTEAAKGDGKRGAL